ncbi:type II secretion system inner membrane protein GspF [Coralloluteibacterium stylophorae]|uniref:General secretion pathway protein F n=1 Tax=Coralloluteibacterium stylophorae TaxID=1776034 RepID=A0A8J7VY79_9GAMM|nr:type II secretion system inner membrane protein GspF [Coralloluteibacterium stylophorae]MBS7458923.1 type II secretion system inner membrane protein GspF [Coralloluteibacterium stylophorae]
MAAFDYLALDPRGRERRGTVEADGEPEARSALEGQRLFPVRLAPAQARPGREADARLRLRTRDLALLTRQLASLVAVAPLEEALRTIAAQTERRATRAVLQATHARLVEGHRLSDAMAAQPRAFPPLYRAMVAAGEGSGALPHILERLADLLERQQEVRGKLVTALVYPAALALTALAVIAALMIFVVPRVVEQFETMGRELPFLTRVVIALSDALAHGALPALVVLVAGGLGFAQALRRPTFRRRVDALVLRLPVLGRLLRDLHAARLARTLSVMLASGLPVVEGLAITARTVGNRVLREATEAMVVAIREGGSLSAAMRRAGTFPPTLLYMASSGENSGRLAPMLDGAADYLEREFNTFTAAALSLLEPAIIVLLGGVVAVIVLSILLPILQFNTLALH